MYTQALHSVISLLIRNITQQMSWNF